MILQHPIVLTPRTPASATAFVVCPAAGVGAVPQAPHPVYALALEQARRAVAVREFRRQIFTSSN
jgi:hypothetical protein